MSKGLRRVVRAVAVALFAAVPLVVGPCWDVQHPPPNTEIFWGMAIAWPE